MPDRRCRRAPGLSSTIAPPGQRGADVRQPLRPRREEPRSPAGDVDVDLELEHLVRRARISVIVAESPRQAEARHRDDRRRVIGHDAIRRAAPRVYALGLRARVARPRRARPCATACHGARASRPCTRPRRPRTASPCRPDSGRGTRCARCGSDGRRHRARVRAAGSPPVSVLASAFLDRWLPVLPRASAIVLALCTPHRATLVRPATATAPVQYAYGDVTSWLERDGRGERIELAADSWTVLPVPERRAGR